MLGLGLDITKGGAIGKPDISTLGTHAIQWLVSTTPDSGNAVPIASTVSLGDIRMFTGFTDYTGSPSDYEVTSLRVRNNTVDPGGSYTELISTPLTLDSAVNYGGAGIFFYFFDNDSPMDDIDMGSASGHPQAHNGTGSNAFSVLLTFNNVNYEGSKTISSSLSLNDSDA